jgi:hypothetical protein
LCDDYLNPCLKTFWAEVLPLTLALSPKTKNVLGEREGIVGMLTQRYAKGSYPALALG